MKRVIYKYPVMPDAQLELPVGAQILSVATQRDTPHIWALVDPEAATETRTFRTVPTGHVFDPTGYTYIGTFHDVSGWMVFHLFEKEVPPTTK